jgi:hypothetical protein
MPTVREILERESFFDAAILRHGFVDYMRDYELIVEGRDPVSRHDLHRYLFVGTVEVAYELALPRYAVESFSDDLVPSGADLANIDVPDGFVWGVRWAAAYPGLKYRVDGLRAQHWSALLGCPMHEVSIETNVYRLQLVFAGIRHAALGTDHNTSLHRREDVPIPPVLADRTSDGVV